MIQRVLRLDIQPGLIGVRYEQAGTGEVTDDTRDDALVQGLKLSCGRCVVALPVR